jgi:hypothetical protein
MMAITLWIGVFLANRLQINLELYRGKQGINLYTQTKELWVRFLLRKEGGLTYNLRDGQNSLDDFIPDAAGSAQQISGGRKIRMKS